MGNLKFLTFYTIFILFVSYISALAGLTIYSGSDAMQGLIDTAPDNYANPLWYAGALGAFMSLSTEFTFLYALTIAPLIVGIVYIVASLITGAGG